jgi:hypothetical protein
VQSASLIQPLATEMGHVLPDKTSERPWYYAVMASAGLHVALILAAAWIVFDVRTAVRPADLEAVWADADSAETLVPASTSVLEITAGPGGGDKSLHDRSPGGGDGVAPLAQSGARPSHMAVHFPPAASHLSSNWLTDSRSAKGLTDVVGPIVYGTDGRMEGPGGGGGSGGGSGGPGSGGGGGMKASFFGVHTDARRVVYVVDASTSMNRPYDGEAKTRFGQMKLELAKSILSLKSEQQFFVVFFNEHAIPMPSDGMAIAAPENQQRCLQWIASVPATGLTDPRPSIALALSLNPDVVFLLTDGAFPRDVTSDLGQLRQRSAQINTIAFGDMKAEKSLKPLALKNRGRFAFVP